MLGHSGHYNVPAFVNYASTQNAGTGATLAISKPASIVTNDVLVSVVGVQNGSSTWTGDTGWTEVFDQGTAPDVRVAYLVAGASEPGSYTFTSTDSSNTKAGVIVAYRNAAYDTVGSISALASTCVAPSINAAKDGCLLLAVYVALASGTTFSTPTGMTAVASDSDSTGPSWAVFSQEVLAGATGDKTSTASSGARGILISLSPA